MSLILSSDINWILLYFSFTVNITLYINVYPVSVTFLTRKSCFSPCEVTWCYPASQEMFTCCSPIGWGLQHCKREEL